MILHSNNKKFSISTSQLLQGMLLCCGLLTGILPQRVLDVVIVACCFGLLLTGDLILAYPFVLFYYGTFGLVMSVSTYRIFSLFLAFDTFLKMSKKKTVRVAILLPMVVYVLYLVCILSDYSIQRAVFCMIDILCVLSVVSFLNKSTDNVRAFFEKYAIVTIFSILTGLVIGNTMTEGNVWIGKIVSRFTATFEDPNYMGFFLTIAVFATVILKLFTPTVRRCIVLAIYAAILASASMTALLVHVILWLVYLLIAKKISFRIAIVCFMVIAIALGLYQYGLQNPDAPLVGNTAYRIQKKLLALEIGDMSEVTTSRSDLTKEHWDYFWAQPLWKKLIGGGMVNTLILSEEFEMAAHNEYVDMLLNVGLLGTAIMLGYMFHSTIIRLNNYNKTQDETQLFFFIAKCTWLAYAMTLTLFLEFRFMVPFFI